MLNQPYFMKDEKWFTANEDGEYVLTKLAPKEAVEDYNKCRDEYLKKINKMSDDEYVDFLNSEDSWLSFPTN